MQVDWKGIYPAITTKFHEDGSLDLETFQANLEKQIEAGIHGIVVAGTLGEASTLTTKEKFEIVDSALEVTAGEIPVILNIAEGSTRDAIEIAQKAEEVGAHGLMLLPPMMYGADDREVVAFYSSVAESTELPILVYNNPVDYGIEITLDMLEELIKYDNIQAIKESTRDITNVTRIINRFGDRIKVLPGVDTLATEELIMGADGWVAGIVAAFPEETVAIYELVKQKRFEEARDLFRWFLPLCELDINSKLVQNIKLAEVATGMGTEHVRPPRLPLVGEERKQVEEVISTSLGNRPELPDLQNVSG